MRQTQRIIERLLAQNILPTQHADTAAKVLGIYPNRRSWQIFFDKILLIIGVAALALSLVFFIAYNWLYMGKLTKFALVEGGLVITIALYVALSFRQRFRLIRQLLLLIASIITGSLLALFGQVYQTGADTWQLFFGWAVLIIPWVIIARFPALWLLWLGLLNTVILFYVDTSNFSGFIHQDFWQFAFITLTNFAAFYLWLIFFEEKRLSGRTTVSLPDGAVDTFTDNALIDNALINNTFNHSAPNTSNSLHTASKSSLHWSTYTVALLSAYTVSYLTISTLFDNKNLLLFLVATSLWLSWCVFMHWRFYKRHIDLLMLTYLSGSVIAVIIFALGKALLNRFNAGSFLLLGLVLIGMSAYAVVWLRKVARFNHENNVPRAVVKRSHHD